MVLYPAYARWLILRQGSRVSLRELKFSASSTFWHGSADKESGLIRAAVDRAKEGDPEGVHFLYVRFAPEVHRYAAAIVSSQHEAEDITQNIFAKLIKGIGAYERRESPFTAWILRVARNAALDHLRAKRTTPTAEVRSEHLEEEGWNERGLLLRSALKVLPADQREVLVLRHVVGLSPGEIAERLDKSESSVHGLHHRGRKALRAQLTELGASPMVVAAAR